MWSFPELTVDVPESAPIALLEGLESRVLFYPCAGADFKLPVTIFASVIDVFWFVDRGYFSPGHQDTRYEGLDRSATDISPLLVDMDFEYLKCEIQRPPVFATYKADITFCILTEYYNYRPLGRTIQLKFRRGYGFSAFDKEIDHLSVFFYRGDSWGEGGSGNFWFKREPEKVIWNKLVDHGWLVTDFSLTHHQDAFRKIARAARKRKITRISDLLSPPFQYYSKKSDITFTCLGYLGKRYGPTMVFRVDKGDTTKESKNPAYLPC
jgi:hypothetical protein